VRSLSVSLQHQSSLSICLKPRSCRSFSAHLSKSINNNWRTLSWRISVATQLPILRTPIRDIPLVQARRLFTWEYFIKFKIKFINLVILEWKCQWSRLNWHNIRVFWQNWRESEAIWGTCHFILGRSYNCSCKSCPSLKPNFLRYTCQHQTGSPLTWHLK
jgi:hypothetical protein